MGAAGSGKGSDIMPLCLVCPCGHSAPLPLDGEKFTCTKCQRKLELARFRGPRAWREFRSWILTSGLLRADASSWNDRPKIAWREVV